MCDNKIIETSDRDVYLYGMKLLVSNIINTVVVLLMSLIFGHFLHTIYFLLGYWFIKRCSGGFHASNHRNCILFFSTYYLIWMLIYRESFNTIILVALWCISLLVLLLFSPVEDPNKPLEYDERKIFQKKSRILFGLYSVINFFVYYLFGTNFREFFIFGMFALISIGIMILLGLLKNAICKARRWNI